MYDRCFTLYILVYLCAALAIGQGAAAGTQNPSASTNTTTARSQQCGQLMFDCGDNNCIPRAWRCDGDTDCLNGNDERECPSTGDEDCEQDGYYKCDPLEQHLEGLTPTQLLRVRALQRLYPASCIPKKWVCDGEFDCPAKDDEMNCKNNVTCEKNSFLCPGYEQHLPACIPDTWVCDGQSDCADMSDERNCSSKTTKCRDDEWQCTNGQCIFAGWKCDGEYDCRDRSDENAEVCDKEDPCSAEDRFQCQNDHFCIPKNWTCDGQADCPDHSDEKNCTTIRPVHNVTCRIGEYQCKNKVECIRDNWRCDGDEDCTDGSDEDGCTTAQNKCGVDEQLCDDGNCRLDCTPHPTTKCNEDTHFKCPEGPCIPLTKLCSDNSSANDCQKSVCSTNITKCNVKNAYCHCRDTMYGGSVCYCPSGFQLAGDICLDVNECDQPGICDQICNNTIGSYSCDCHPGFHLTGGSVVTGDARQPYKCRASGEDPLLLLSNRAMIRQYDLVTNKYHPLVKELDSAVAMDYWHANQTLIWSDVSKEQIMICHLKKLYDNINECKEDGSLTLISEDVHTPDGLAIDWVHGLLFWTDTGLDTINVYDLARKQRKVLFNTSLEEPRAIAVDPAEGLVFWTDWGSKGRIERAGMNGRDRVEVISGDAVRWPNGLALDLYEKRVYWADAKTRAISSCNYWGKEMRTVLHSHKHLKHPFSLAVFEEKLYWTDWDHEGVLTVNKFSGQDVQVVMNGVTGPMTVRIYHQMAQPKQENKCSLHRCEHICLPRARIHYASEEVEGLLQGLPYSCACGLGFQSDAGDSMKCTSLSVIEAAVGGGMESIATASNNALTSFFILGMIVSCVLLLGYAYRKRKFTALSSLGFENPVYRRTVEDLDGEMEFIGDNSVGGIPVTVTPADQTRVNFAGSNGSTLGDHHGIY